MSTRSAEIVRETKETRIRVAVDLDRPGAAHIETGIGFFDHMLEQVARHGALGLTIEAHGDLHIDGTTRSKMSASRSDRPLPRRPATSVASVASATPTFPWTRRSAAW